MPVIEQVADHRAAVRLGNLHVGTCQRGHIFKPHLAQVAEDGVGLGVGPVGELRDVVKNVPTGYEQVLPAIVIKVRDPVGDRKSTRLNSSHGYISYAVFCLKKKKKKSVNYYPAMHEARTRLH